MFDMMEGEVNIIYFNFEKKRKPKLKLPIIAGRVLKPENKSKKFQTPIII